MLDTPVLFLVFNRPDTTARVFEAIRAAKPKQLFIVADGPRPGKPGDKEKTEEVRKIALAVDWDCAVNTLFRENNLGCGRGVSEAITWFFEQVEKGIILEDDCVPNPSFFYFCQTLLEKYKDDNRIGQINGSNFQLGRRRGKSSYYFSNYPMIWGWATWRYVWQKYEYNLESYPINSKKPDFWNKINTKEEENYWKKIFETMHSGFIGGINVIDTWDYQWLYTFWKNGWLAITPNINLIANTGFGEDATHTTMLESKVSKIPTYEIGEVIHPSKVFINRHADKKLFRVYYNPPIRLINRIRNIAYKTMPKNILFVLRELRRKYFSNLT